MATDGPIRCSHVERPSRNWCVRHWWRWMASELRSCHFWPGGVGFGLISAKGMQSTREPPPEAASARRRWDFGGEDLMGLVLLSTSQKPQHRPVGHQCTSRAPVVLMASPAPGRGPRKAVLLVEDTEINRVVVRRLMAELNMELEEAENGEVAVELVRQGRTYDLILMDKQMPVMDGHEATRQLRSMGVMTPIVALSGDSLQSDRDLFLEAGADHFQAKPLLKDELIHILSKYGLGNSQNQ